MGWLRFGTGPFLDHNEEAWQVETWRWLLDHLGGRRALCSVPLVTPARAFFPPTDAAGYARTEHIFAIVKQLYGMADWPCRLAAQPRRQDLAVGDLVVLKREGAGPPAGTFGREGEEAMITYDPAGLDDPIALVATFAHELAHYRLATVLEELPGGQSMHEFATDLATVHAGFGLFGANSAFNFRQFQGVVSQGWSVSRLGYLSPRAWIFALAIFLELRSQPDEDAKAFLKPHLFSDLRKARRYLQRRPVLLEPLGGG